MKIVDCFMFYNELDVLEIRLKELYDVVDAFVIVEATHTHNVMNPKEKPLYYLENKARFEKYNDKIVHVVTNFRENYPFAVHIRGADGNWFREIYQRECIRYGLRRLSLDDSDIILVSDADEIVRRDTVLGFRNFEFRIQDRITYSLEMTLYYYSIEYTTPRKWYHAKAMTYKTSKEYNLLSAARITHLPRRTFLTKIYRPYLLNVIPSAGFHLTYFGGVDALKTKVESFAESSAYTTDKKDVEHLRKCHDAGILHFNGEKLIHIPLAGNADVPLHFKALQ